jgi:hypothetical protein
MGESMFDKAINFAKDQAADHPDQVDSVIDKLGDLADNATGRKYTSQIDSAEDKASDGLRSALGHRPAEDRDSQ